MVKCRIHVHSPDAFMDERAFIDIKLPCLPRIGDTLHLDLKKHWDLLFNKVKKVSLTSRDYFEYITDYTSDKLKNCDGFTKKAIENMDFSGTIFVHDILFHSDKDYVSIAIHNE